MTVPNNKAVLADHQHHDVEPIRLFLASTNLGKVREFRQMLPPEIELLTPIDIEIQFAPETGETFAENAITKAVVGAQQTGMFAIADDSGLEVDALDGAPGVYSARFAGEPLSDERNRIKVLDLMNSVPNGQRQARFRCVVALASPAGVISSTDGVCEGLISWKPRGTNGFGYDPIFQLADGRTMAELSAVEKNQISHRALAYQRMLPMLLEAVRRTQTEEG